MGAVLLQHHLCKKIQDGKIMIVLCTGVGRTGTSKVAGLLHNNCAVNMGTKWVRPPDNFNPQGYYEDLAFGRILENMLSNEVRNEEAIQQVKDMLAKEIEDRSSIYTRWGFKANTLFTCLPMVVDLLPEYPHIIRTKRPIHQTILSWVKTFRSPFKQCMTEVLLKEHLLDLMEEHYKMTTIHFDSNHRKTDMEILNELIQAIPGLRYT